MPDYFLDEAEDIQEEFLQSQKSSTSEAASADSSSSPEQTPAALFAQVETMLNSDVVGQIKSTYLFVLDGNHPGE